ncbi:MAG: hypothetical protein COW51_04365, partial [Candidatus Moranbacteria bacterium CG17_big_fil_post_rev_8_21_14_2_50_44_12]
MSIDGANEATYGITVYTTNVTNPWTVWDRFEFVLVEADDTRINVGGTFELRYKIRYDYDDATFDSSKGSITGFVWDSVNVWWDKTVTGSSSVTSTNYDETYISITDSTYGLTVKQDVAGVNVITDRLQVQSYTVSDSRDNINDDVTIDALIWFDYDNTVCTTATITINGYSATHQGSGVYRIIRTSSTVTSVTYNTVASSAESTYGITAVDQNGKSTTVIWDRIVVYINANSTNPNAGETIQSIINSTYEFDGTTVTSWTVNVLRNSTHFATGNFTDSSSSEVTYQYATENVTENTYGLTVFTTNTLTVIWANLFVEINTVTVADSRINIGEQVLAYYHCRWSSNQSDCTTGTLYVNTTSFSINGTGWATVTFTFSVVDKKVLVVTGVNVNGETDYGQVPPNPEIIWDRVEIYYFAVDDLRVNINDNVEVKV